MESIYRPLLEECIGGTDLLSDLGEIIGKGGKLQVRKAGKEQGSKHSMHILLDLMDVCQHKEKWSFFYKALEKNDFGHVIAALKEENIPETVRRPYCEILLKPENVSYFQVFLTPEKIKLLTDGKLISCEDSENILSEKDMTGSDSAAILVLLDRLWRGNASWISVLSSIFQDLGVEVLSNKLNETEPKELQVSNPNQWNPESKDGREEQVENRKVMDNQEETYPKTAFKTKQGVSCTAKMEEMVDSEKEPLCLADTSRLNLPSLETPLYERQSYNLEDASRLNLHSIESPLEESPERLSSNIDRVKVALDEGNYSKKKEIMETERTCNEGGNDGVTSDQVQSALNYLDATVERSARRNDSAPYNNSLSENDEDSEKSKKEKDIEEDV